MAAGSLKDAFTAIFADYSKQYGASFVAVWGPSGALRERLRNGEVFDIFASAALPHAQALTEAGVSGASVLFTRNALCIVTGVDRQLDSGNLVKTLLKPEIRIGTSTPVSDPAGDYTWEMFRKVDARLPGSFETLSKRLNSCSAGLRPQPPPADVLVSWSLSTTGRSICSSITARVRERSSGHRRNTNRSNCRRSFRWAPNMD
jgi:molybdate transport system substrate-binding protein